MRRTGHGVIGLDLAILTDDGRSWYKTGIAIFEPQVLEKIPARTPFDMGRHLLPALLAAGLPVHGYVAEGYWNQMASFADYHAAQEADLTYSDNSGHVLDGTCPVVGSAANCRRYLGGA